MRVACLRVANFPLAVCYRAEPDLRDSVVAITEGKGARAKVVASSVQARELGIECGVSAAQARAICDDVVFRQQSEAAVCAAQNALCDIASAFSPRIEDASAGVVYLEVSGTRSLYGAEAKVARGLVEAAEQIGFAASAGVASTKIAAHLAARGGCGRAVIPPQEEWSHLAPLPLSMLEPDGKLLQTLNRWGVRTLGELAALPADAVMTRLGVEGAHLVRRARGEDETPFVARVQPLTFEEVVDLDYGIETVEPFLFVVRPLLERALARLRMRGLVCGDIHLRLRLANRGRDERTVQVAAPCSEPKPLLALLRLHLESNSPTAPVEGVCLAAKGGRVAPRTARFVAPQWACSGPLSPDLEQGVGPMWG